VRRLDPHHVVLAVADQRMVAAQDDEYHRDRYG
jgi:hypothetical protein